MTSPVEPPEFIEVQIGDQTAFVPFEKAVADPEISSQVIEEALSGLRDWKSQYGAFVQRVNQHGAEEVVEAISRALDAGHSTGDGLLVDSE